MRLSESPHAEIPIPLERMGGVGAVGEDTALSRRYLMSENIGSYGGDLVGVIS